MSKSKITKNIKKALLQDGKMEHRLYEFELLSLVDDLKESLAEDKDEYMFALTERGGDVAMVLIEPSGDIYINEEAREKLKALWPKAYEHNIKKLTPYFVNELISERIPVQGVKTIIK